MNTTFLTLVFITFGSVLINAQTPTFEKYIASDASLQVTGFSNDGSRVVVKDTMLANPTVIAKIIRKIGLDGQYQWSTLFKGNTITAGITANKFLTDENGNVYLLGRVKGKVYYNGDSLQSDFSNAANVLVVKFTSSGSIAWKWQSSHDEASYAADDEAFKGIIKEGSIFIGGNSKGRDISFGTFSFPRSQYNSMNKVFVARFDTDGNLEWATMAKDGNLYINSIDADDAGNVYYGAQSSGGGTIDFGNGVTMPVTENCHYVAKYNGNGEALLAKTVATGRSSSECKSASVDNEGNMYVSGFNDWPSSVNGITLRAHVSYITKLDNTGAYQWTRTFTSTVKSEGVQTIKFTNGKLYFTANPVGAGGMYVQSGTTDSISKSNKGVIIGAFSPAGMLEWNEQGSATAPFAVSSSASIIEASPDNGSLFFGGTFIQDEKFGTLTIPTPGAVGVYHNGYIQLKTGNSTTGINERGMAGIDVEIYPNPAVGELTINLAGPGFNAGGTTLISVYDMQGKKVLEESTADAVTGINVQGLQQGMYFLKIENRKKHAVRKLIIE